MRAKPTVKIPRACLPLYARIAIERVRDESEMRDGSKLDMLLTAYAKTYGLLVDSDVRESCFAICIGAFGAGFPYTE